MRGTIYTFDFKKIVLAFIFLISFIIIVPLIVFGGWNNKADKSIKDNNSKIKNYTLNNEDINMEKKDFTKIKVYITKENKIEEMDLEDYVAGVVSSEMPVSFGIEALKAQAVAARTYALSKMINNCKNAQGADVCDSTHCQVFMSKESRMKSWESKHSEEYWNKVLESVQKTKGEVLTYDGSIAMGAYYFSTSSGKTENASEVFASNIPYLKSVNSPGEEIAPKFKTGVSIPNSNFINKINNEYKDANLSKNNYKDKVKILSRNEGGSVREIKLGGTTISGTKFRSLFNLNSANFTINYNKGNVEIVCKGYGHGLGMSQWGANAMAKSGNSYKKILEHYYKGIEIKNIDSLKL